MKNKVLAMFLILTMLSLGIKTYATTISDYQNLLPMSSMEARASLISISKWCLYLDHCLVSMMKSRFVPLSKKLNMEPSLL